MREARGLWEQTAWKGREGLLGEVMPGGSVGTGHQLDFVAGTEVCAGQGQSRGWRGGEGPLHPGPEPRSSGIAPPPPTSAYSEQPSLGLNGSCPLGLTLYPGPDQRG